MPQSHATPVKVKRLQKCLEATPSSLLEILRSLGASSRLEKGFGFSAAHYKLAPLARRSRSLGAPPEAVSRL